MTDYTDLQKAAEYAAQDTIKFADEDEEMRALQQFHEEVDPETVLALIAENESARKHWQNESNNVQALVAEVGRLKAENERLRTDYAGLASFNPEWDRVAAAQDSVREHMEMVTQLRAEVAGLRTGYEAYERVNAGLKAENEALRKDAPSKEIIWCACGDGYPVNSHGAGFMDANDGVCANCDAAMGKGEQS